MMHIIDSQSITPKSFPIGIWKRLLSLAYVTQNKHYHFYYTAKGSPHTF